MSDTLLVWYDLCKKWFLFFFLKKISSLMRLFWSIFSKKIYIQSYFPSLHPLEILCLENYVMSLKSNKLNLKGQINHIQFNWSDFATYLSKQIFDFIQRNRILILSLKTLSTKSFQRMNPNIDLEERLE